MQLSFLSFCFVLFFAVGLKVSTSQRVSFSSSQPSHAVDTHRLMWHSNPLDCNMLRGSDVHGIALLSTSGRSVRSPAHNLAPVLFVWVLGVVVS